MSEREKLQVAVDALKRIFESDPGPAYYIARDAIREIEDDEALEPSGHQTEEPTQP